MIKIKLIKLQFCRLFILALVLLFSLKSYSVNHCGDTFFSINERLLNDKLGFFPELKTYVESVLASPQTELKTRRLLKWFTYNTNIKLDYYANAPSEYKEGEAIAFNLTSFSNINFLKDSELDFTRIYPHPKHKPFKLKVNETGDNFIAEIYLPGKGAYNIETQFGFLIHEIAHIKFNKFLDDKIEKYVHSFPSSVLRVKKGNIFISEGLLNYLSERYAYETEFNITTNFYQETYQAKFGDESLNEVYQQIEELIISDLGETHNKLMQSISFAKGKRIFDVLMAYQR